MTLETVAIISPGDMGHAVGRLLRENGLRITTCLAGRSARTRGLSQQAGIIDVPALDELVRQADILLSITVSEAVPDLCRESPMFCNAPVRPDCSPSATPLLPNFLSAWTSS